MLRSCLIAASVCLFLTPALSPALAQEAPQVVREKLMKGIGQAVGALGAIAKGEKPYDAAVVQQSLTTISTNIQAFPDQFPPGTETGHETEALPAIWEKPPMRRSFTPRPRRCLRPCRPIRQVSARP